MEQVFITGRDFAVRLGFPKKSANGIKTNHVAFLSRKAALHPETFPKEKWLGGRKVYRLAEVEKFESSLPDVNPAHDHKADAA